MSEEGNQEVKHQEEHHEPAGADNGNSEAVHLGPHLFIFLMVVSATTTICSTIVYWFRSYQPGNTIQLSLWFQDSTVVSGGSATTTTTAVTDLCDEMAFRLEVSEAFALISCFISLTALLFGIITWKTGNYKVVSLALGAALFVTSIICWAPALRVYVDPYCTSQSLKDVGYDLGPGALFMFTTTVLSPLAVIALYVNPTASRTKEERRRRSVAMFTFLCFCSTLLCSIGCGTAVWKYRTTAGVVSEVSIWTTIVNGVRTNNFELDCYDLAKYWRATAALSIASSILSGVSFFFGLARFFKPVSVVPLFIFGGLTTITTLITWALLTTIWGRRFCDSMQTYEQSFYIRLPAYGFFVASFAAMFLGTLLLVKASIANRKPETTLPPLNVILVGTTVASLVFALVGMTQAFFELTGVNGNSYTRIYLWFADSQSPSNTFTHSSDFDVFFGCDQMNSMFRAVRYLQLVGVLFGGIATLFVFMIFKVPRLRILVLIANYFCTGLYGLALLLWIIAYRKAFCSGVSVADQGFAVVSGGALQIIGFLLTLYGAVLPCIDGRASS